MRICKIIAVVCLASSWSIVNAQTARRDGRWDVTMEMDMPNMPMKMPAIKTVQCITKEQADDPNQVPMGGQEKNKDCKVSDYKVAGSVVTWTMKCEGKHATTGNGEFTYAVDSYDGWMKVKTDGSEMTMKYKGKRLGDCTQ